MENFFLISYIIIIHMFSLRSVLRLRLPTNEPFVREHSVDTQPEGVLRFIFAPGNSQVRILKVPGKGL